MTDDLRPALDALMAKWRAQTDHNRREQESAIVEGGVAASITGTILGHRIEVRERCEADLAAALSGSSGAPSTETLRGSVRGPETDAEFDMAVAAMRAPVPSADLTSSPKK